MLGFEQTEGNGILPDGIDLNLFQKNKLCLLFADGSDPCLDQKTFAVVEADLVSDS